MFEKNEMFFVASGYGPLGKSAWWLFAWFAYCWHFLWRGFAQTGLDKFYKSTASRASVVSLQYLSILLACISTTA
jgi:hypothetical protein